MLLKIATYEKFIFHCGRIIFGQLRIQLGFGAADNSSHVARQCCATASYGDRRAARSGGADYNADSANGFGKYRAHDGRSIVAIAGRETAASRIVALGYEPIAEPAAFY